MTTPPLEVRGAIEGHIDEIVASNPQSVHVEQLSDHHWYLGITASDGTIHQFWFGAENGRSRVRFFNHLVDERP